MQMVATLGSFRLKPDEDEEKSTMKHSNPGSDTESEVMDIEIHSDESEIANDPLWAT